jgi:peptidoglycan/LPS O-acetylase OafA/YrhL
MFAFGEPHQVWHVVAAAAILYTVLGLAPLNAALSTRPSRFLGDISFGLYLVHVPILYTVFVPPFLLVRQHPLGLPALFGAFLIVSIAVGLGFTVLVDHPTLAIICKAREFILRRRAMPRHPESV